MESQWMNFDVRFEERDLKRVAESLKKSYGEPLAEARDRIERREGDARVITKIRWEKGDQRAVLTSQEKKRRGFKFVGTTILYAFMQAVGMVNDHEVGCFRWKAVQRK